MTPPNSSSRLGYLRSWMQLPRNLAFLFPLLPIAIAGFVVTVTLVVTGLALTIVWVGIPIIVGGLLAARGLGALELRRLEAAGQRPIDRPVWSRPALRHPSTGAGREDSVPGWFARSMRIFRRVPGDGRYWVYAVFLAPVNFVLAIFSWTITVVWAAVAAGGLTYWIWERFLPRPSGQDVWLHAVVWKFFDPSYSIEPTLDGRVTGEVVFYAICGFVFLVTLAPIASVLVAMHHGVARGMLGERRSARLERRAAEAEASRESALIAEDHGLRRLERDIHDGPQQRLIRLQYDLASAERRLDEDPEATRELLTGALQQSKDALEELRELSRGFAPPILQDRGLGAAVVSLAARTPIPVNTDIRLQGAPNELADVERSAYFIVSELLTNVTKHAQARRATVALTLEPSAAGQILNLLISDDGRGGALERPGHGLTGVRERLAGLRGTLTISSPEGGPTAIAARIPIDRRAE